MICLCLMIVFHIIFYQQWPSHKNVFILFYVLVYIYIHVCNVSAIGHVNCSNVPIFAAQKQISNRSSYSSIGFLEIDNCRTGWPGV